MGIVKLFTAIFWMRDSKFDLADVLQQVYYIHGGADKGCKYWKHISKVKFQL